MTMINPKILILPDIHGRKFYCNALCEAVYKGAEIVCLGDYLDPYRGDDLHEKGVFAPLKELVDVKEQHPVRIGDRAYCLDCRQPFYIDKEGVLRSCYWGDKPINAGDGISR